MPVVSSVATTTSSAVLPIINDANTISTKQKLGYSECVQECLRFMNNNSTNATTMINNNNFDPASRQRLISNLMKQFQSINSNIKYIYL